jgi:hypothetical protein
MDELKPRPSIPHVLDPELFRAVVGFGLVLFESGLRYSGYDPDVDLRPLRRQVWMVSRSATIARTVQQYEGFAYLLITGADYLLTPVNSSLHTWSETVGFGVYTLARKADELETQRDVLRRELARATFGKAMLELAKGLGSFITIMAYACQPKLGPLSSLSGKSERPRIRLQPPKLD